jgi:steroid delta-isomerase-like uncharacterized protein
MSTEENKATVLRAYNDGWSKANMQVFDELFAKDFAYHDPGAQDVHNLEELKQWITQLHANWSTFHLEIKDVFGAGDRVAVRGKGDATGRDGEVWGVPVSGKSISWTFNSIYRLVDGRIVENWNNYDLVGILRQLGAVTPPEE